MFARSVRTRLRSRLADQANASAGQGISHAADFGVYALLGGTIGLLVAVIEWISIEFLLHEAANSPLWLMAVLPGLGLAVTALILRTGGIDSSTSDNYVKAFHGQATLPPKKLPAKMAAAIATLGSGGALGLEGPAVHLGATLGRVTGSRLPRYDGPRGRALLAAGAAAGVAAVFKAPATGVLFALESPYRRDLARHALLPSLVASASAYLVFVPLINDDPLLRFGFIDATSTAEVLGALIIGLLGGLAARGVAWVLRRAKAVPGQVRALIRVPIAAVVLGACVVAADALVGEPITLGPGADTAVSIVLTASNGFWVIAALLLLRLIATSTTLAGGGVGGLFIPLVVIGILLGRLVEIVADAPSAGLFPAIGLAAVLGAGYRTPLAAVMFVAESTGRAEFVIPALLATATSQIVMGDNSVSTGQVDERKGHLEHRLGRPVSDVTINDVMVLSPDDRLADVIDRLGIGQLLPALPVHDGQSCELLVLNDIASAMFEHGEEALVSHAIRSVPPIDADSPAIEAARLMNTYNSAAVAVIGPDGYPIGIVTAESLAGLSTLDL